MNTVLDLVLTQHKSSFHPLLNVRMNDKFFPFDFTVNNKEITDNVIADTPQFSEWINNKLALEKANFGIGGYNENRILYRRSKLFAGADERSIHLGLDIWGPEGTTVYAPLGGMVHSFGYNETFGDYGATIILQHQLDTVNFYTLYGHLSKADLTGLRTGKFVTRGEVVGHFGNRSENGDWPPHLHLQVIRDIGDHRGDYPGVCTLKDAQKYLANTADPSLMLNLDSDQYISAERT